MTTLQITQAMIDAYDEYTHLTLDRRGFMEKLTKLAGSGAAAATIAPLLAANSAQAAITAEDNPKLKAEQVSYPGSKGPLNGYLARPADQNGKLPAVIVIHENRGLNPHIRDVARRVALEGFVALAPDFLSPLGGWEVSRSGPNNREKGNQMMAQLAGPEVTEDYIAAVTFLRTHPLTNGKVGVVGFCWGGAATNQLAVHSPDLDAAVPYYGRQPTADDVAKIHAPIMAHYGALDKNINQGIPAFEESLKKNNKKYSIFVYDGANHAFNNDTGGDRYNKPAAELAWKRTVGFLKENLKG